MHGQDADIVCFFSNPPALLTQFNLDSMVTIATPVECICMHV